MPRSPRNGSHDPRQRLLFSDEPADKRAADENAADQAADAQNNNLREEQRTTFRRAYQRALVESLPPTEPAPVEPHSPPPAAPADSFSPRPEDLPTIASGEKAKARDIVAAIRVLKTVESEGRPATAEERQKLGRFAGFGPVALSIFPDPQTDRYKDGWQELGEELRSLPTAEEYESAKRTTFNAFYTSPTVIRAMHEALARLGVPVGGTVLEPGCGSGNFLSLAPAGMSFVAVELDSISGRISKLRNPGQDIRVENFRDTKLPALDGVRGNVPFADVKMEHAGHRFSLHDYFFAKSVDALRPGGALALVTSHFTLDKQNAVLREFLANRADFLGAIRLPASAFQNEGTAVVTDIVFLRRRAKEEPAKYVDPDWLTVAPLEIDGAEVAINRYFLNHPEMVLGTWSRWDTLYGEGYSVVGSGVLADQLREAIGRLPAFAPARVAFTSPRPAPSFIPPPLDQPRGEGSFFVSDDGTICQLLNGQAVPVDYSGQTLHRHGTHTGKRLTALIRLRDLARRVLRSQNEGWPDGDRQAARRDLNWAYDRFTMHYGPINRTTFSETKDGHTVRRMPNLVKFREDPDAMLVMALEEYDEATGRAKKAPILTKDVVGRTPEITSVQSAEEGLLVSLDRKGAVDMRMISKLYGKREEEIIAELGDLVFHDPESKTWQAADAYLSGNVRAKLAAVSAGPEYGRNAEALQDVQPEDVLPGDIDANLGAPWVPTEDIRAFIAELLSVERDTIQVAHLEKDAVWSVEGDYAARASVAASSDFGTDRANALWLLEQGLNMKTPVIYDPDPLDPKKRVVNPEETFAAREKLKQIKERFKSWVFTDIERTERLVRVYNDTYNNLRPRLFDGSHLEFPGMSAVIQLRQHQRDAVWRCMSGGNTLLAHLVGAGKTNVMCAAAVKMKQAGLIHKPMIVCPNHMLEQFGREFLQLYPNAKLLVASKEDFTRDRRKMLTAKIASGDWDGIIVTHSSFERIGMSREYQEWFLREQIAEYERLLCESGSKGTARAHRNLIKTIEKQKAAREERLQALLAEGKKDDGLVFDELGIDHLSIDECQAYKNLETPTKMERVAGVQTSGSERAFDLYMKCRYLHDRHAGHGITFASGTPVSNTMVELYTLQRYLDPDGLRERGIDHFDAWAATFGEVIEAMEISPDGKTLKPRSRFAKFVNLPELQMMFRSFADVQTADMLQLPRPEMLGGKPQVIACPMSDEQRAIQAELVERYERLRSEKVDPRIDNALAITTDERKLTLDARLLRSNAPNFPESKINALVGSVATIWRQSAGKRGTQLVFCDMGVHKTPWGYSAYEEVVEKLAGQGMPREQIASIGEADTDAKKQALFERVRSGQVRVLLGSTQKMGMGTNVQKRLVALHHLDAPWKPAEVEQREGRILRQGNDNAEVAIYRYVTEGSFDAYMWQALETKARFIAQVMTGRNALRRAEDVGGQELSYAEVKAIASGNPAGLTLAEADAQWQRLSLLQKNHLDEQYLARRRVRDLPATIARLSERLAGLEADTTTLQTHAAEDITIGERSYARADAIDALAKQLAASPHAPGGPRQRVPLGIFRDLRFGLVLNISFAPEVYLEGRITRLDTLSREHHGPRAILNALTRIAESYGPECERVRKDLAIAQGQLRDYEARLGRPFVHETYLTEVAAIRDQLRTVLSGLSSESGNGTLPTAAELTESFRALKEANTVESSPERLVRRESSAAKPITARIRRRLEGVVDSSRSER
jgi:N12 class adenine-specific DNA methylase